MSSVEDKARELQRLHADPELLLLVNVWDLIGIPGAGGGIPENTRKLN